MKEQQLASIVNSLAEKMVPAETDLWSGIRRRLEANQPKNFRLRLLRNRSLAGGLLAALIVLITIIVMAITPQGQAWAQEVLQFFSHAEGEVMPHPPAQLTAIANLESEKTSHPTPYQTETPGPGAVYDVSLAEAGKYAHFELMEPGWLPDTVAFAGASFNPEWKYASITYLHNLNVGQRGSLLIREEPIIAGQDCRLCKPVEVGATEQVEKVQIGDAAGEFANGTWYGTDAERVWEDTPYVKTLRWQIDGMAFEMIDYGVPEADMGLTKDEMISIAESMK